MATPDIKHALLLGSSYSAVDILMHLKKQGLHVSVVGSIKEDPCHVYADRSFFVDYSKPELVEEILRSHKFDYVVPSCNDASYLTGAAVAAKFGYKGFDNPANTAIMHNKADFRNFTEGKIKVPERFRDLSAASSFLSKSTSHELIVKPTDSFSGKGVTRVRDAHQLESALTEARRYSKSGDTVIEQFVPGRLLSHSAFLKDQQVCLEFFVDEYCLTWPYQVDASNHPSSLSESLRVAVRIEINKMAKTLGLVDGLLHTQFIAHGEDFWIIECMRRCPGDLYYYLIQYSTEVDYVDLFVRGYTGGSYAGVAFSGPSRPVMRHTVSSTEELAFASYSTLFSNERQIRHFPLKISGEKMKPAPFDKAGIVFIDSENHDEMFAMTPKLKEMFKINRY